MIEDVYEMYAFAPDAIATFQPKRNQTRTQEAKQMAREMLEGIQARGAPVHCNGCRSALDLPAALVVLVPKDPDLDMIGGCLCWHCLSDPDVLAIVVSAFDKVAPGARLESVQ
jgi:hypothetical protein